MKKREQASGKPAEEVADGSAEDAARESGVREREASPEMSAEEARDTIVETREEIAREVGRESGGFVQDIQEQLADIQREYDASIKPEERADALSLESGAADAAGRFERAADAATEEPENVRALTSTLAETEAKLAEISAMTEFMNYPGGERGATFEKEWLTKRVADLKADIAETEKANQAALLEALPKGEPANDNALPEGDREAMLPPAPDVAGAAQERMNLERMLAALPPETAAKALEAYDGADEGAFGGIASKGILPDGSVRLAYADGTIVEMRADGKKLSNRPEKTGGEPFPAFVENAEEFPTDDNEAVPLLTLESDVASLEEAIGELQAAEQRPEVRDRVDALSAQAESMKRAIRKKNTPEGIAKEIDALRGHIAEAEADLNLAPEDERAAYADLIDKWSNDLISLEERRRASGPDDGRDTVPDDAERMTLEDDPRFQELLEEKSLDLLLDGYRGFAEKYAMSLAPDGTVMTKDGQRTGKEPSEFLTDGDKEVVRQQAKEIFGYRHPADKAQYDRESDPDAQQKAA